MGRAKYEPCFVYGLHDPRSGTVFYIGTSTHPMRRLVQHRSDPGTAAYRRHHEILQSGSQPQLIIFLECEDRDRAQYIERRLIEEHRGLSNRRYHIKSGLR